MVQPKIHTRPFTANPAPELLTRKQTASILQINDRSVEKLVESQYLPRLTIEQIIALSRYPLLEAAGLQPVLRQALIQPAPSGEARKYIGESATLSRDDVLASDREWWRCNPDVIVDAGFLPVTLSGFVVTVLQIEKLEDSSPRSWTNDKGKKVAEVRHSFKANIAGRVSELGRPDGDYINPALTPQEKERVEVFLHGRSAARSGGPIAYLPNP